MASMNVVLVESQDVLASLTRTDSGQTDLSHHLPDASISRLPEHTAVALVEMLSSGEPDSSYSAQLEAGTAYVVPMLPDLRDPTADPAAVVEDFSRLGDLLDAAGACLVILGVSTFEADDNVHDFTRNNDTFAVRANRLTAGLQKLCAERGYQFVDVDRTIAEIGAAEHAPQPGQFSNKAARFVIEDVIAAITAGEDPGDDVPPVSVLRVPDVDARALSGHIRSWGHDEGDVATEEVPLVQIEFRVGARRNEDLRNAGWLRKRLHRRRSRKHRRRAGMTIDIKSPRAVAVASILAPAGEEVVVGQPIAVLTCNGAEPPADPESLPEFPAKIETAKR